MSGIVATIARLVVLAGAAAILLGLIACCTNANDAPAESQALLKCNNANNDLPPLYNAVV